MNARAIIRWVAGLLDRLSLERERAEPADTLAAIERDIEFRGVNLWVLICAVVVASVGLNVNSTAVIIGAMLISPLMGPIIGIGVSLATYNLTLLKRSARNFGVAVLFSVLTSALYFALSPLTEAQSELLARTSPTIWDVLIAFFGGLAGIIAATSREKKLTVIAGVAIATALMPPLCTAGYGIARWDGQFFFGAIYLFSINTVFISTAAYLVSQLLRFPKWQQESQQLQQRVYRIVLTVVIVTVLPSIYLAWRVVQQTVAEQRVRTFIQNEFSLPRTTVVNYYLTQRADSSVLQVILVGDPLDSTAIADRQRRLAQYGLAGKLRLEIVQGGTPAVSTETLRAAVLEDFYQRSEQKLRTLEDSIRTLEQALVLARQDERLTASLAEEVAVLYPSVRGIAVRQTVLHHPSSTQPDTLTIALVEIERPSRATLKQLEQWLRTRTRQPELRLVVLPP
ncbi:MAG: membrane protein [Candidatus Kapaibacterium sp.]|nr:MAG: membrane protein [Candidatus Kapabacteria bacterium]